MKTDPRIKFLKDPIVIFCIVAILTLTAIYLYLEHPEKVLPLVNLKRTTFQAMLNNQNPNKTNFKYYE